MVEVVVVGAGAIGTWLAVRMSRKAGQDVALLGRPGLRKALDGKGPWLELLPGVDPDKEAGGELVANEGLRVVESAGKLKGDPFVFIAVRAYQTRDAARALKSAGVVPRGVVTLQNGLGNAEVLADVFGEDRVAAGTTSHGVLRLGPGSARHTGWGDTVVGPWVPQALGVAEEAVRLIGSGGIPVDRVDDPRPVLWRKVAVNAAINPATAIHRVPNGALLDDGPLQRDLRSAAREVALVAQAEGVALGEDEAEEAAVGVARRTARNRSSMLQALEAGRRLETDAITGEVVKRAKRHGIEVPVNKGFLERLRVLGPSPEAVSGPDS